MHRFLDPCDAVSFHKHSHRWRIDVQLAAAAGATGHGTEAQAAAFFSFFCILSPVFTPTTYSIKAELTVLNIHVSVHAPNSCGAPGTKLVWLQLHQRHQQNKKKAKKLLTIN